MNYASLGQDKRESATASFLAIHTPSRETRAMRLADPHSASLSRSRAPPNNTDSTRSSNTSTPPRCTSCSSDICGIRPWTTEPKTVRLKPTSREQLDSQATTATDRRLPQPGPSPSTNYGPGRETLNNSASRDSVSWGRASNWSARALARRCNEAQGEHSATPKRANEPHQADTDGTVQLTDCLRQLEELTSRLVASPAEFSSWSEAVSELESVLAQLETHASPPDQNG